MSIRKISQVVTQKVFSSTMSCMPTHSRVERLGLAIDRALSDIFSISRKAIKESLLEDLESRQLMTSTSAATQYLVKANTTALTRYATGNTSVTGTLTFTGASNVQAVQGGYYKVSGVSSASAAIDAAYDWTVTGATGTELTTADKTGSAHASTSSTESPIGGATMAGAWVVGVEDGGDNDFNDWYWSFAVKVVGMDEPKPCPPDGKEGTVESTAGRTDGGSSPSSSSSKPVSYQDGTLRYSTTDVKSSGFGLDWGQSRAWTNRTFQTGSNIVGNGFVINQLAHLVSQGDSVQFVKNSVNSIWFMPNGSGGWNAQYFSDESLAKTGTGVNERYSLTDTTGAVLKFYGFDTNIATTLRGQLISYTDQDGNVASVSYDGSNRVSTVTRQQTVSGNTTYETTNYSYISSGANAGLMSSVTLQRKVNSGSWATVRSVAYSYYDGTSSGGNLGDLALAEIKDESGNVIDRSFYRYYKATNVTQLSYTTGTRTVTAIIPTHTLVNGDYVTITGASIAEYNGTFKVTVSDANTITYSIIAPTLSTLGNGSSSIASAVARGYASGLKMVVDRDSYDRMVASGVSSPMTADDSLVKPHAINYFEFDGLGRVTKEIAQGAGCSACSAGQGTYLYTYAANPSASTDMNIWSNKTTVTLPDSNKDIVYTNSYGQVLLKSFKNTTSGQEWVDYYRYDSSGRVTLHALPSAVTGYSESNGDLVGYSGTDISGTSANINSTGLVELTEYGTSPTANTTTAGDVVGYLKSTKVRLGDTTTVILTGSTTYIQHTDSNGASVYPIATSTVYKETNGTLARTVNFTYTWFSGTNQMATRTIASPAVSVSLNGSGSAVSTVEYFDVYGRTVWFVDGDGYLTYNEYDPGTGALTQQVQDSSASGNSGDPTRSSSLPTALNITTTIVVDGLGRATKVTDPNLNVTYNVYNDTSHEVRTYRGWNATTGATTGPIEVYREDRTHQDLSDTVNLARNVYGYTESFTMSATPTLLGSSGSYTPKGDETITGIQSLRRDLLNAAGQVIFSDTYTTSGLTYATTPTIGALGTDYLRTEIGYDDRGRRARILSPDGTWNHTVFDGLGRFVSLWKGTNNAGWTHTNPGNGGGGGNNMLKISENIYDAGASGDSNLTESRTVFGPGSTDYYPTKYQYDFRNRLMDQRGVDNVAVKYTYDNLGEKTNSQFYADSDADFVIDSTELRGRSDCAFDERGMVFQSTVYRVDPTTGTSDHTLVTNNWYDGRGDLIKTQDAKGLINKNFYDGTGRVFRTSVSVDPSETAYSDADDLTGDQVIEMNDIWLDKGSRARIVTNWKRDGNEVSTVTGVPTAGNYDHSVMAYWYDAANRIVASANYGRDGAESGAGSSDRLVWNSTGYTMKDSDSDGLPNIIDAAQDVGPGWDGTPTTSTSPYRWIYSTLSYDAAGRQQNVTDNAGRITKSQYDLAGRITKVIENYDNGTPDNSDTDKDRTTENVYDAFGRLWKQIAYNPKVSSVESQSTIYLYADDTDRSLSNYTIYPDSGDTYSIDSTGKATITGTDHTSLTFDRLGRALTSTDQRGVTHTYTYDTVGRFSSDAATTITSGVDDTVKRIGYTYDDLSRVRNVTSYDATTSGNTLNDVQYAYDGWGNITRTYQAHDGAVSVGTTPYTEYLYDDGAVGNVAKYVRLSQINYPASNGGSKGTFKPYYEPTQDVGKSLNRMLDWRDGNGLVLVSYKYLGADMVINQIYHSQVSGGLMANEGNKSSDYNGYDRYYRLGKTTWQNTSVSTLFDARTYTYDRMGNRLTMTNSSTGVSNWDETYTYDGLNRLTDFKMGSASSGVISNPKFQQSWTLDSLGNWRNYSQTNTPANASTNAALSTMTFPTFSQTRAFNSANEIDTDNTDGDTDSPITGGSFAQTMYDKSGNMARGPKTGSESTTLYFKYDAWNRQVGYDATTGGDNDNFDSGDYRYSYDGLGRRISKFKDTVNDATNNAGTTEEYFYNEAYQTLEVRVGTVSSGIKSVNANPKERVLWDLSYVDTPAMIELDTNATPDGNRDNRLWPMWDANYNVVGLVTDQGKTVEHYAYTPYGQQIVINGESNYANTGADSDGANWTTDTNGSDIAFNGAGFQGLRYDVENGNWYQRARYNNSALGVFEQRDPLGTAYQDGMNLYLPVEGNPINGVDPSGLYDSVSEYGVSPPGSTVPNDYAEEKPALGLIPGDLAIGTEIDIVAGGGFEAGGGIVFDFKDLADSGLYYSFGGAFGENIGWGIIGVTYVPGGDIEGDSIALDANVINGSGQLGITIEPNPKPVLGFSYGPGAGASLSYTRTETITFRKIGKAILDIAKDIYKKISDSDFFKEKKECPPQNVQEWIQYQVLGGILFWKDGEPLIRTPNGMVTSPPKSLRPILTEPKKHL